MERRGSTNFSRRSSQTFIRPSIFDVGGPITDVGNKYIQSYGSLTPANVKPVRRGSNLGVRMEDYALVERVIHPVNKSDVTIVVITDGHGSVPAYSKTGQEKEAERWIGGYDVAKLAGDCINQFIKRVCDFLALPTLGKDGIARVLYDSFSYAQKRCEQETMKGGRMVGSSNPFDTNRLGELMSSMIDGEHFRDLYERGTVSRNPWIDPRCVISDKVLQPYADGKLTYYVDGTGKRKILAEYGCTATAAIFVPTSQEDKQSTLKGNTSNVGTLFLGHTGDTDAYLFYRNGNTYDFVRLTGNHSITNRKEVERLSRQGMAVRPPYFTLMDGPEAGQSLMPSRSLGHSLLSKHGISYEPTVATTSLSQGDIVVIATDGLWSSYGVSKGIPIHQKGRVSDEDLSAMKVAEIISTNHMMSSDDIAQAIRSEVEKTVAKRDNVAIVVVKVNK